MVRSIGVTAHRVRIACLTHEERVSHGRRRSDGKVSSLLLTQQQQQPDRHHHDGGGDGGKGKSKGDAGGGDKDGLDRKELAVNPFIRDRYASLRRKGASS